MKFKIALLILVVFSALNPVIYAQTNGNEEDPFESDPFFNKPLKDWFSAEEIRVRVRRTSDRIYYDRGVDEGQRDVFGLGESVGMNSLNKMYPAVRFNRVEGLYLGLHLDRHLQWGLGKDLQPYGSLGYSFGRKDWLYTAGLERFFGYSRNTKIGVSHHRITDTEDVWRTGWNENSIISFLSGHDFMDYYARNGTQIYMVVRANRWLELSTLFTDDKYESLDMNTRFSLFGKKGRVSENPLIDEGKIQIIGFGLNFNPTNLALLPRWSLSGDLSAELSDRFVNNTDYDFSRYQMELRSAIRIDRSAILRNRLRASAIGGDAPNFKWSYLGGMSTLRAHPHKSLSGTHSLLFNSELHLGSTVSGSKSGRFNDDILDLDNLKFVLFADMGWIGTELSNNAGIFDEFKNFKGSKIITDVGAGINFSALRVEAAWNSADLTEKPVIWIRFNQTF
jgi:hypothetical protein